MKALLGIAFLIGLATSTYSQSAPEVPMGTSYYSFGGDLLRVDATENPDATPDNAWVQGVDASGFSGVADGTGTATGVITSGEFSTNNDTYKISGGHVYRKSKTKGGHWVKGKKVRSPRSSRSGTRGSMSVIVIKGDEVVSLPY